MNVSCPKARSPVNVLIFIILVNSILLFLQPVSGMATGTLNTSHEKVFSYSVKIINPRKKSEYVIKKLRINNVFKSIDDLKDTLSTVNVASTIDQVGFIEPGHGAKGRQQWLTDSEDLKDMYSLHQYRNVKFYFGAIVSKKQAVVGPLVKAVVSPSVKSVSSHQSQNLLAKKNRYDNHAEKMIEVESIEEELENKHNGTYSREQLRAWAHLIQMGKHDSLDLAPNKPFWKTPSGNKGSPLPQSDSTVAVSPGKKIQLQGQLFDQLLKWHDLLEKGGIDQQQYNGIQASIMENVKKF